MFGAATLLWSCSARPDTPAGHPARSNQAAAAPTADGTPGGGQGNEALTPFDVRGDGLGCGTVASEADYQPVAGPSGVQPVRNLVVVDARGAILWNGAPVDLVLLRQYLDITSTMRPTPMLLTRADPGAAPAVVEAVKGVIFRSLDCRVARL